MRGARNEQAERPANGAVPRRGNPLDVEQAEPDDERYPSVTAIIGDAIDHSNALMGWLTDELATKVVDRAPTLTNRLQHEGRDSAVEYVKGLRWDTGGDVTSSQLGTIAHALFDAYADTGTRPEVVPELHPLYRTKGKVLTARDQRDLVGMVTQFERFLGEFQPDYLATEVAVFNTQYRYAGQADTFMRLDGVPVIGDYKTSRESYDRQNRPKGPYPEAGLQLAAYRHAEFAAVWRTRRTEQFRRRYYLLNDAERQLGVPVPAVEGGVVIYITPERYDVYPVRCDARVFDSFLYVMEVARFVREIGPRVVGNPMVAPHPVVDLRDPFRGLPA